MAKLEDATLKQMLDKVNSDRKYVIALAEVKAGNALKKGKIEPLTPQQAKTNGKKSKK